MKHGGRSSYRKEAKLYLPSKTQEEIQQHKDWHQELLYLQDKKREVEKCGEAWCYEFRGSKSRKKNPVYLPGLSCTMPCKRWNPFTISFLHKWKLCLQPPWAVCCVLWVYKDEMHTNEPCLLIWWLENAVVCTGFYLGVSQWKKLNTQMYTTLFKVLFLKKNQKYCMLLHACHS